MFRHFHANRPIYVLHAGADPGGPWGQAPPHAKAASDPSATLDSTLLSSSSDAPTRSCFDPGRLSLSSGSHIARSRLESYSKPYDIGRIAKFARDLKVLSFYHLWIMMLLAGFAVSFIATLFKVFGLSFINDDQFLAIVGSVSAILNSAGRIVWGLIADRVSYKFALVLQSGIMAVFLLTFFATSLVGKSMFFVWVCVIFFCVGGIFSLYPTAMALSFGPKYMSINYGLLFTSQISSSVIAAVLFSTFQSLLGWDGMIFLVSGISLAGFLITMAFCSR